MKAYIRNYYPLNCKYFEGKDFEFTKRIKYVHKVDRYGKKTMRLELEVKYSVVKEVKVGFLGKTVPSKKEFNKWVSEHEFGFDFSDETTEEIYECN